MKAHGHKIPKTIHFNEFPTTGSCKDETGFSADELMGMWKLARKILPDRMRGQSWAVQNYFYAYYLELHQTPSEKRWKKVMTTKFGPISLSAFRRNSIPIAECIAKYVKTYHWEDRLHPSNHRRLFPHYATCVHRLFSRYVANLFLAGALLMDFPASSASRQTRKRTN